MIKKQIKKENKTNKLNEIYSFLDDKEIITNVDFKKSINSENDTITKKDILSIKQEEPKVIKKEIQIPKEISSKKVVSAIDDDLKEESEIVNDRHISDLTRALDSLSNPTNLESGTILTNNQVIALSTINYLAQVYDIPFFKHFVKSFPRYRISGDDGRGRKEIIEIANAIRRDKEEEHSRILEMLGRR